MYLLPMWCLWRSSAMSLCSEFTKRTRASPFLRPWAFKHSATPPLRHTHTHTHTTISHMGTVDLSETQKCLLINIPHGLTKISENPTLKKNNKKNMLLLGNVEALEEASDVLVWRLPWQPPGSDHCLTVHSFCLTAARQDKVKTTLNCSRNLTAMHYALAQSWHWSVFSLL